MRCHICDKQLSDQEISFNPETRQFEPCTECLTSALDAAYSDGFKPSADVEKQLEERYGTGESELLDVETEEPSPSFLSWFDYMQATHKGPD